MDGKRFGIGIAAGLLFGLAVIASSGNLGAVISSASPSFSPAQSAGVVTTTTASTVSLTQSATFSRSTNSSSQPVLVVTPGNTTDSVSSGTSAVTTSTTNGVVFGKGLTSSTSNFTPPAYASRIGSIEQQPLLTSAVVLVPLLVAFLLGAILYRASSRNKEEPSQT